MAPGYPELQSWAADVIDVLREAHQAVEEALARGDPALDAELLARLRERYDEAAAFGITHNRHRDWHDGNHPGYTPGCWLRDYAGQVWLFTREPGVEWTNNCSVIRSPVRVHTVCVSRSHLAPRRQCLTGGSACRGAGKGRARQKTAAKRAVRQLGRSHNCPGR